MAEISNIKPEISLGGKQTSPITSAAEMLNMAAQAQALQQARALNPVQLQTAQQQLTRLQALTPEEVKRAQAEARVAEETAAPRIEAARSQSARAATESQHAVMRLNADKRGLMLNVAGAYAVDPRLKPGADPNTMFSAIDEMRDSLVKSGFTATEAMAHVAPFAYVAGVKPDALQTTLQNMVRQNAGAGGQLPLQTPSIGTFGGQPAAIAPGAIGTTQVEPIAMPGQQPAPAATPQPGAAPAQQGQAPSWNGPVPLQYPVRQAGQPFAPAPSEGTDLEAGKAYRAQLGNVQLGLPSIRRNLDEVQVKANEILGANAFTTGTLGDIERRLRTMAGDVKYKELSKDLANVEISMIRSNGGSLDTVAGQHLQARANGDETYPPEVLVKIARRMGADVTNSDMQATAAQRFAQRFGDNNMSAFKQAWSANADSKVFEAMNLYRDITDPAARKKAIDELLGSDPKRRQEFAEKYRNIQKLTTQGAL